MPEFNLGINNLRYMLFLNKMNNFVYPGIQMLRVIAHQGHAQLGFLPQVMVVHLGDGGLKAVPDFFKQAFNNLPFPLERLVIGQMQSYSGQGNNH